MRILNISRSDLHFQNSTNYSNKKKTFLDKFYSNAKNSADLTDTIVVPRTIFKGYLGIMTGTTFITLGCLTSKFSKISKSLSAIGTILSAYGTYAFVRPYVIKDTNGVIHNK